MRTKFTSSAAGLITLVRSKTDSNDVGTAQIVRAGEYVQLSIIRVSRWENQHLFWPVNCRRPARCAHCDKTVYGKNQVPNIPSFRRITAARRSSNGMS